MEWFAASKKILFIFFLKPSDSIYSLCYIYFIVSNVAYIIVYINIQIYISKFSLYSFAMPPKGSKALNRKKLMFRYFPKK